MAEPSIERRLVDGEWRTVEREEGDGGGLPDGGSTGEVLTKASGADQDVEWAPGGGSLPVFVAAAETSVSITAGVGKPAEDNGSSSTLQGGDGKTAIAFPGNGGAANLVGGTAGVSNTDANDGGQGGNAQVIGAVGAVSVDGYGGSGGQANVFGGAGAASTTGKGGGGGQAHVEGGSGGDSDSGDGGDAEDGDVWGGNGGDSQTGSGGAGGHAVIRGGTGGTASAGAGNGGPGGDIFLLPGVGGSSDGGTPGTGGRIVTFDGSGLAAADRPSIATQVGTVDVAAFNDLRSSLIAIGLVIDGD